MANSYQIINESTWERAMHCVVCRNSVEHAFCVTFEVDITNFKRMVKESGVSFTLVMVYAGCKCANNIEAFRYRECSNVRGLERILCIGIKNCK